MSKVSDPTPFTMPQWDGQKSRPIASDAEEPPPDACARPLDTSGLPSRNRQPQETPAGVSMRSLVSGLGGFIIGLMMSS
jgi:hypothetical protein